MLICHQMGISTDSLYEPPASAGIQLDASGTVPAEILADQVISHLRRTGIIPS